MELSGHGVTLIIVSWLFQALAIIVVSIRMYARICLIKAPGRDDWTMVAGLVLSTAFTCMSTVAVCNGTGHHYKFLLKEYPEELPHILLLNKVAQALAVHSFDVSKLAIAFLIVRIFNPRLWLRFLFYSLCGLLILLCVSTTFIIFLQCDPVNDKMSHHVSECWSPHVYASVGYATGATATVLDLIFAIYPSIVCAKLNMKTGRKIGLAVLFGVGFVAAGVSIYKTVLIEVLTHVRDITYDISTLLLWTNVEANVVIIAGSIPTINPVIRLIWKGRRPSQDKFSPNGKGNGYDELKGRTAVGTAKFHDNRRDSSGLPLTSADVEAGILSQLDQTMSPLGDGITRTIDLSVSRQSVSSGDVDMEPVPNMGAIPEFLALERSSSK